MKPINVFSSFDGMAVGLLALKKAGVPVNKYIASEIDKYAMQIAKKNHPEIDHIGDIRDVGAWLLPHIDLFIGGSPCQGFSFAGGQLAFDHPQSVLFFEYVRLLKELRESNPDLLFMLENVPMKKEYERVITEMLGVEPIRINSALVSAQNRKRLYWTNIEGVEQPEDRGHVLKDVIHEYCETDRDKSLTVLPSRYSLNDYLNRKQGQRVFSWDQVLKLNAKHEGRQHKSGNRMGKVPFPKNLDGKAGTLTRTTTGRSLNAVFIGAEKALPFEKTKALLDNEAQKGKIRKIVTTSGSELYCMFDMELDLTAENEPYIFSVLTPDRLNKRQNGRRFSNSDKFYTLTKSDRHGILTCGYIRKVTPVESERLQTLPDNYTEGVSDTRRYEMLGNGWTADVIAHIFSYIPKTLER